MKLFLMTVLIVFYGLSVSSGASAQSKTDSAKSKRADTTVKPPVQLKEVTIKAAPVPVRMKGDTVSFNAKAFKTRVNSTVEDLIKKLPGLQVDEQGRITFQGKSIEKIYIDGKDYYLNDPKLITQNLTADMIDRIEVFDQQSKQSRLTGVKDIDPGKALNLKLKKGVNLDFTGKVYAGYGSRGGYGAGAKGSSFIKDRAITGTLSSNNINDLTEERVLPFSNYGRSSSDKAALQYSAPWGKQLRANLEYEGGDKRLENRRSVTNRQNLLADSTQLQNRDNVSTGNDRNHSLRGNWELAIDSVTDLNLESSLSLFTYSNKSRDTLQGIITPSAGQPYTGSSGSTNTSSDSRQTGSSNAIRYDRRLKKRTLSVNLSQNDMHNDRHGAFNSLLRLYAPDGSITRTESTDQRFTEAMRHAEYVAGFSDAEQLRPGRFLKAGYGYRQLKDRSDKQGFNYNPQTGQYDLADTLTTSNFSNSTVKHQVDLGYVSNSKKINYSLGIILERSVLANSEAYRNLKFNRGFGAVLPSASFSWNSAGKNGSHEYRMEYSARSQQPNPVELQPVTDNRDPMQLVTGNPDLRQAIGHEVSLHYNSFDTKTLGNLDIGFMAVIEQHSIITTTEILAGGVQKVSYANREGKYTLISNVGYEVSPGAAHQGKLRFTLETQYGHSPALLNGKEILLRSFSSRPGMEFRYRLNKLELNAESRLSYEVSRYSDGAALNTAGLIQNYKLNAGYDLPLNMLLKTDYRLQLIGAQGGLRGSSISVWNASLLKNVLKSGRGEFKVSAYDLLNSNKGFYQRIAPGYIQQTTSNVLGRLILFSFIYHIRSVPQENEQQ